MSREVRFATTSDGVRVAYGVEGDGPIVVMSPLLVFESFVYEDISPGYRRFSSLLARRFRLVQFDGRGVGQSGSADDVTTVETAVEDLAAVIDAVGGGPVDLIGRANASPGVMVLAAERPELVRRLALYAPFVVLDDVMSAEEARGLAAMCRGNWEMGSRVIADISSRAEFGDAALANAEWYRRSMDGERAGRMVELAVGLDVSEAIERVACPTAVFQPMNDIRWAPEVGQRVAATIPGASFVPLGGGLHSFALGDPLPLVNGLSAFFGVEPIASTGERHGALRAVLFSDIVAHTELMARLGDDVGRLVIREHDRISRDVIDAYGGTEVKRLGDGFMASFGSARDAVESAIAFQTALAEREGEPFRVRIGISVGEPIEEEDDLYGASVIQASRICALAEGGEILVADAVRSLCAGKGLTFVDRGEFLLKGFSEPERVFQVVGTSG